MKSLRAIILAAIVTTTTVIATAQVRRITPYFPCSPTLSDAYGFCSHITRPFADFYLRQSDLRYAREAGAKWIRSDFDCATVMPEGKEHPRDSIFDAVKKSCEADDMRLLPILTGRTNKAWAWDDEDGFYAYVDHLVRRYKGRIGYWEVINEVNLLRDYEPGQLARNYAKVLRRTATIIRAADKDAKVVFGGMGENGTRFLGDVCDEPGTAEAFDILNFHSYDSPEQLADYFAELAAAMSKRGLSKPVWLTETGFTTPPGTGSHEGFWRELVPYACGKLGINPRKSEIAVVCNAEENLPANLEQMDGVADVFRRVRYIKCNDIAGLNVKRTPFLIPSYGEYFPKEYEARLVDYVRRGGTIICPIGVPFYYDMQQGGQYMSSGHDFHKDLHMAFYYFWQDDCKRLNLPEVPDWGACAPGTGLKYAWNFTKQNSARYLSSGNLRAGDEFIPLLLAGTREHHAPVAGIYKLRSDLRGNIIIQTRVLPPGRNETTQAERVARAYIVSFACGADKVFWYHLRAFETDSTDWESYFGIMHKDFTPKPAYAAYQALTRMLPDGSSRPQLEKDGTLWRATWTRPDRRRVEAVWSVVPAPGYYKPNLRRAKAYDYMGRPVRSRHIVPGAGVTYFVSE